MTKETVTLYFRHGVSDKMYQATLAERGGGFIVEFAFGRRGNTLQTGLKTFTPLPFDEAKKIYDRLVREKMQKGYSAGTNGLPYSGTEIAQRNTGILPQLLNAIDETLVESLIADPNFWMQQKHDGKRVIIQVGEKIVGINRTGLTIGLPQSIAGSAAEIGVSCIIDGEAVGEAFHAFDLIALNGRDLRSSPYRDRHEKLFNLIGEGTGSIKFVETYCRQSEKGDAFDRLKRANAEGVVFKNCTAPYTPGRLASGGSQLKHKFVADGTFIVAGVNAGKRSIGLEIFNASGQRQYVGNVTVPPNQKIPKVGALVEIRYLYAFRVGCLFQPVLLGVRDDIDSSACTTAQLKFKHEEDDDGE
ncbi:MAG: WGR domain-containing protein [Planctomycetota bacterium]